MKLTNFRKDAITLASKAPVDHEDLEKLLGEVGDALQQLLLDMAARQQNLEQSLELQQFLSEHKNMR